MTKIRDLIDEIEVSGYFSAKQTSMIVTYVKLAYEIGKVEIKEFMVKELKDIFKLFAKDT